MDLVTIVNRTPDPLTVVWDGKRYELPPGPCAQPSIVAEAAKRQNPIMGTEDPYTGVMEYKVGVEAWGDPVTPLTRDEAKPRGIERIDRTLLIGVKPTEIVRGNTGIYSVRDVASNIGNDTNFVKA